VSFISFVGFELRRAVAEPAWMAREALMLIVWAAVLPRHLTSIGMLFGFDPIHARITTATSMLSPVNPSFQSSFIAILFGYHTQMILPSGIHEKCRLRNEHVFFQRRSTTNTSQEYHGTLRTMQYFLYFRKAIKIDPDRNM
jgi:hypothetical protein